jgi:DNA ligase (NAD+)
MAQPSVSVPNIVDLLERASRAYYNGGPLLMDDESFDALVAQLQELEPSHPFLATVGAPPPAEGAVELPHFMPSLDKIKPGQGVLTRFLLRYPNMVISEKLDGLSALWCPSKRALYLRGDGRMGQTVSQFAGHIQGLVASAENWAIRGELILPRAKGARVAGARATVNGLLHQKAPPKEELARVRFIAYEVISPPNCSREAQMLWLGARGFETPWWKTMTALTEEACCEAFRERRESSPYETDGIVVGANAVPLTSTTLQNPKDCVAFKMPTADQSALTTVREVIWAPSAQGYLIPRLRFDPVKIGGASIEFCTAHNARTVVDRALGPGARVKIRRSGDVIPTLDSVLFPAESPALPPDPASWAWAQDPATATHIISKKASAEQTTSQLLHFAKTHDIAGLGPANCKLLVKAAIDGPAALWKATATTLGALLGPKTGESVHAALRVRMAAATELDFMLSSSVLPRGVGESKLKAVFGMYPDPREWSRAADPPSGWTLDSFREFQREYSNYERWRTSEIFWIPYPILVTGGDGLATPSVRLCFTGFRDKELECAAQQRGFEIATTVTQSLGVLVTPDGDTSNSEKVKKAAKYGSIEILTRSEFVNKYMNNH